MGALISFLGGSAFRLIWGELASYFSKKQEHKYEQQRMLLQGKLDSEAHTRQMDGIRIQAQLGIKTIEVQRDADVARVEADAWRDAVSAARAPTGIKFVDAWNGLIRPLWSTFAIALWAWFELRHMAVNDWMITAFSLDLIAMVAGFVFADRSLLRRGK